MRKPAAEEKLIGSASRAEHIAEMLRALAHPLRIRIVALLCAEETHVNALAERLQVKQAIVSQQLRILRMRRLVEVVRQSGFARYRIAEPRLRTLIRCMEGCTIR
jgi:DNA-binding transcriptional ArsR family regulator